MDLIRVDPEQLKRAANEIEQVAEGYRGLAQRALAATQGAPSHDGQFGPQVAATGDEAHARLNGLAGLLTELQQELLRIAESFAAADARGAAGFQALALDMYRFWDAGLGSLLFNLFRPMHISEAVWNRLPLEDRLAMLESYGLAFVLSPNSEAGTTLYPTNPLRVRNAPGLNGEILSYAPAGSEVTYTGLSRTVEGVEWYQVKYQDPLQGWLIGWVSSSYLSTGRSRVGFEPDTVWDRFEVQTDLEVRAVGGRLMSVTSDWLQIRDGPTHDYAAPEAIQWGQVVRWTGSSIEEGGHTWYEVIYDDDTRGWARSDRVVNYSSPAGAPPPGQGKVWVELPQGRSFSYYTVTDVNDYADAQHGGERLDDPVPIQWKFGGPPIEAPFGALYSAEGVAMQGSGRVILRNGETLYFELDNPRELYWHNAQGGVTKWENEAWSTGTPAVIGNPEDAVFRPSSKAPDLASGVSVAGPPSLRGARIYVPDLVGIPGNETGIFIVEDAGGAFPEGSPRFDIFYENAEVGAAFYRDYSAGRISVPAYTEQDLPPELEAEPTK